MESTPTHDCEAEMQRERTYYVESKDKGMSESFAKAIGDENAEQELLAEDGKRKKVYEIGYELLKAFIQSRGLGDLRFRIWTRLGHGKLQRYPVNPDGKEAISAVRQFARAVRRKSRAAQK